MKTKILGIVISTSIAFTSCTVQHLPVNTKIAPFEKGGRVFGERTNRRTNTGEITETKKSGDLYLLGINVRKSDVQQMVVDLNARAYTIETKSNLFLTIFTGGIVDYRIVKVIKRAE